MINMIKKFALPRGTSDILPDFLPRWEALELKARNILKMYGYREIRTPIYEETALFKRSLGQTSDIVNKQLLELKSTSRVEEIASPKGLAMTEQEGYALRPEGTAAVVRSYLENSMEGRESLSKLFYIGAMFRGERPQKGRLRQFHQIGAEAIGPNSTSAYLDAEMITLAMNVLNELGVKGLRLKLNSLGSSQDKANISAWLRGEFTKHKADLCPQCQERFERNVFRVLDCKNEGCKVLVAKLVINLPLSTASQDYFNKVKVTLTDVGIAFEVAPHLVRGLDYYTHTVFEITAEGLGSQDAVGAGGRYNGLLHELGGNEKTDYGAIGFALGIERVLLASGQSAEVPASIDVYVIPMDEAYQQKAFGLLQQLRHTGISANMTFADTFKKFKTQMERANKANARFVLILGEDEVKNNVVALKDMQSGKQEAVLLKDVVGVIKQKLSL